MSHRDYKSGLDLECTYNGTFYGLIQAAMRRADSDNLEKLKAAWPEVWEEFQLRYKAQGGYLPEEWSQRN